MAKKSRTFGSASGSCPTESAPEWAIIAMWKHSVCDKTVTV